MGMQTTTTNLTYARDTYIKQGRSHIFDRVGDMLYYILTNHDIAATFSNTVTHTSTLTVGATGAGHDVKIWGDTADNYFEWDADNDIANVVFTKSSQTTENIPVHINMTTDSTYLTGSNITYSGARGSSALKLTGTYSGTGGYSNIYSNITTTGAQTTDGHGVVGVKGVVTNSAALTDGEVYGAQFIAKHSHGTNDMGKSASLIGLEAWSYPASTGTVGTLIGANLGYHNECTTTQETGSVHRGVQIFCDDAAGAQNATESTALCLWNMAGTQHNAINVTQSGSGFTNFVYFASATAPVAANTHSIDNHALQHILTVKIGTDTGYIPVFASVPS